MTDSTPATGTPSFSKPNPASLYERLGSTTGIHALVDDIVQAHMDNPIIQARFLPYAADPDHLRVIKGHLCAFLEAGSGGPAQYGGRSMRDAHRGPRGAREARHRRADAQGRARDRVLAQGRHPARLTPASGPLGERPALRGDTRGSVVAELRAGPRLALRQRRCRFAPVSQPS